MLIPGKKAHFVGVGGFGISAIARVMLKQGYRVSGSDLQANDLTAALVRAGATVYIGHHQNNLGDAEVVVVSSAIPPDNVEVVAAKERHLPVYKRADMLGALMREHTGVAVAGTHGKTTTTSMIVHILLETGLDPTYIVGGVVSSTGTNAGVGQGSIFVIEADEYDHMFLGLCPQVAVITNVEHDHPDLFATLDDLAYEFNRFAALLPPDGLMVVCADDSLAWTLGDNRRHFGWPVTSYGVYNREADWQAAELQVNHLVGMNFTLRHKRGKAELGRVVLRVPGIYNVQNALAALIVADHLDVPLAEAMAALSTFAGSKRRFEVRGQAGGVTVIDDYAHHPTAIRMTLEAAREHYPDAGIWAVWQPHTYSRFRALYDDFVTAFPPTAADHVLITDIFAARESSGDDGPNVPDIVEKIDHPDARHAPQIDDAVNVLAEEVKDGDVVIVLSAGDGPQIGVNLLDRLN